MKFLASVCITLTVVWTSAIQKSFADVIQNKKPLRIRKVHMKTTVSASLFNKCVDLKACNFIKKTLLHRCFPANIAKFLRTGPSVHQESNTYKSLKICQRMHQICECIGIVRQHIRMMNIGLLGLGQCQEMFQSKRKFYAC